MMSKIYAIHFLLMLVFLAPIARAGIVSGEGGHGDGGHDDGKGLGNSAPAGIGGVGPFPSRNIEFKSQLTLNQIGGTAGVLGNDIWGWTDPLNSKEYAIYGRSDGTAFIEISDPKNPVYLGSLPTHTGNAAWRDIKVFADHAYIVADGNGAHGMQVFDLRNLRGLTSPQTFTETAHYSGFTNAHNIVINEQSGFAYAVGTNTASGGLHAINLNNPGAPTAAGTFSADGYTHDAQVVNYHGPDTGYLNREIAFNANVDTLTIVDVSDKNAMTLVSRVGYAESGYAHQGWLTEDQRYFLMDDELDEDGVRPTRTHVWDVQDLDNPVYLGFHQGTTATRDHNMYIHNGLIYQANYSSGLRVLRPINFATAQFEEIAYFDTFPTNDALNFDGAWSVYPFFSSGSIIVNDRQNGLFVLGLSSVPEPSSLLLLALAGCSAGFVRNRRTGC